MLLVSLNFLNSDFVLNEELPYFLNAARKSSVEILWVRLTPCKFDVTPLSGIQGVAGFPSPLNSMNEYAWMAALCKVCDDVDSIVKDLETPVINPTLKDRKVKQKEISLQAPAKPAWRETEVLVYPGNGFWYTQGRIAKGKTTATCWFGDAKTKSGSPLKIIALTRPDSALSPGSKHPNMPLHRTKSKEVTVKRL